MAGHGGLQRSAERPERAGQLLDGLGLLLTKCRLNDVTGVAPFAQQRRDRRSSAFAGRVGFVTPTVLGHELTVNRGSSELLSRLNNEVSWQGQTRCTPSSTSSRFAPSAAACSSTRRTNSTSRSPSPERSSTRRARGWRDHPPVEDYIDLLESSLLGQHLGPFLIASTSGDPSAQPPRRRGLAP